MNCCEYRRFPAVAAVWVLLLIMAGLAARPCLADNPTLERVQALERARIELVERVSPTVISVFRVHDRTRQLAAGSGSGVIISPDGYALTNYHVTGSSEHLRAAMPGGQICEARRCGVDPTGDIAVIKIETDEPLPYAVLGSSDALSVGEWVVAIGNPFMLATDFRPTVSLGIVSGLHRHLPGGGLLRHQLIYADAIQVDAPLNPGNSGGPLFNMRGELVGINGRITLRRVEGMRMQKTNMGIGFAVPINNVKPFLDDLKAGRNVDRGYLGVVKATAAEGGLRIETVSPDSPAEIYDLRPGDVIARVDGTDVDDLGQLKNLVQVKPAGTRISVDLRRGDQMEKRVVQLAGVQTAAWLRMTEMRAGVSRAESVLRKERPGEEPSENAEDNQAKPATDPSDDDAQGAEQEQE